MGYSNDLRVRVIQVVEGGAAARAAARQFVIGDSTAIRWTKRWRETGSFEAKSNKIGLAVYGAKRPFFGNLPSRPTILSSRTSCLDWRRSARRSPITSKII